MNVTVTATCGGAWKPATLCQWLAPDLKHGRKVIRRIGRTDGTQRTVPTPPPQRTPEVCGAVDECPGAWHDGRGEAGDEGCAVRADHGRALPVRALGLARLLHQPVYRVHNRTPRARSGPRRTPHPPSLEERPVTPFLPVGHD